MLYKVESLGWTCGYCSSPKLQCLTSHFSSAKDVSLGFKELTNEFTSIVCLKGYNSPIALNFAPIATVVEFDWTCNTIHTDGRSIFPVIFGASLNAKNAKGAIVERFAH